MAGNILFRVLVWEVQEVINRNVIEFNCAPTCHGNGSGNYFYQNFLSKPGYIATKNKGYEGTKKSSSSNLIIIFICTIAVSWNLLF